MNKRIITMTDPSSDDFFYQEAIKTLRANLQFSGKDNKVIMVTSCFSNEGKSDIAFHLAGELGKNGKNVLLVDADIRNSVMNERYELPKDLKGLTEFLSDQVEDVNQVIYQTNYEHLCIIPAGPVAPNPSEILGNRQFKGLLQASRKVFDFVIVDTAPLGEVIDAAIVAENCDGAFIVVSAGAVSYHIAQKVKKQLQNSGCRILGVVLNKVKLRKEKYGKYGKYGYQKYGYGKEK